MSDPYTCEACGEWCDGHTDHCCPGTPGDRIDEIESQIKELGSELENLNTAIDDLQETIRSLKKRIENLE